MPRADHVWHLGLKELLGLWRDPAMLFLIVFTFTVAIHTAGRSMPESLQRAALAVVDEDDSVLSARIVGAFHPPQFATPARIDLGRVDAELDSGRHTFVLVIPPHFQRDVTAGRSPAVQLSVDATRMSQAFVGDGAIRQLLLGEVETFAQRGVPGGPPPVTLVPRVRFNPNLTPAWFSALMELANHVTMLSVILTGAALIREREHGTVEHLLVMPVSPTEIMLAKIWSMMLVVLLATALSLALVVRWLLQVPVEGSVPLFLAGTALHLFATTAMGIFMATVARTMPQFGLLTLLVLMPLQQLSGALTARESMPLWIRQLMLLAPTTHYTELSQAILYRAAGLEVVWGAFVALFAIGAVLFALSLARFRRALAHMA